MRYEKSEEVDDLAIVGRNRQSNILFINTEYQGSYGFPDIKPEWVKKSGVVSIGSPYSLSLQKSYNRSGLWIVNPTEFIGPFSIGSASMEKHSGVTEGSGGELNYSIGILQKSLGTIFLSWFTDFDGGGNPDCESFTGSFNYTFPVYSNITSGKHIDPLLSLFGMYAVTKSKEMKNYRDYDWHAFGDPTAGIPIYYRAPVCEKGAVCINFDCGVTGKSGQIWVNYLIQWPNLTGRNFEKALKGSPSGGVWEERYKVLQDLRNCIYVNTPVGGEKFGAFYQSFAVDAFDSNYSSFSWTFNNTRSWIDAPANKAGAVSLYTQHGFEEVSCLHPEVNVALYLEPCEEAMPCSTVYKHAAFLWYPDKIGWTSKFGEGPLLTHGPLLKGSMDTIINPWNMDPNDTPCLSHYGIPTLCFKGSFKGDSLSYKFNETLLAFTKKELSLLGVAVGNVPAGLKESFGTFYEEWLTFTSSPHIHLSSSMSDRAAGAAFESLISLGEFSTPLVVEKLVSPHEFKALVLYERIAGIVEDRGSGVFMSLQEQAAKYAHEWLEAYSVINGYGLDADSF